MGVVRSSCGVGRTLCHCGRCVSGVPAARGLSQFPGIPLSPHSCSIPGDLRGYQPIFHGGNMPVEQCEDQGGLFVLLHMVFSMLPRDPSNTSCLGGWPSWDLSTQVTESEACPPPLAWNLACSSRETEHKDLTSGNLRKGFLR